MSKNKQQNKPQQQQNKPQQQQQSKPEQNASKSKPKEQTISIGGVKYNITGNKVGGKEFAAIATGTGRGLPDLKETILNKGFSLSDSGKQYYQTSKNTVNIPKDKSGTGTEVDKDKSGTGTEVDKDKSGTGTEVDPKTSWQWYRDLELEKGAQQGEFGLESDRIRSKSAAELAKIQADASNYGYDRQLEGAKYATDSEERWRQAVATIEGDKKASLQNIINAGLKDVAEIEGAYSLKNVEAKGKYDTQIMGLRTQADKDIARMDANQKMYNLLGLAFG